MYTPTKLVLRRPTEEEMKDNRNKTLQAVERYRKAQAELERICAEKGIPVPIMVCQGSTSLAA